MEFRTAVPADLSRVNKIFRAAARTMDEEGIPQWDELYPSEEDLREDILRSEMTLGLEDGVPVCAFTLNRECDPEYSDGVWSYSGPDFCVLHRLCVDPACQHRGIASQAMDYLEGMLREKGCRALRLDVFSQNPYALRLYAKHGFRKTGQVRWRKGIFYFNEKVL